MENERRQWAKQYRVPQKRYHGKVYNKIQQIVRNPKKRVEALKRLGLTAGLVASILTVKACINTYKEPVQPISTPVQTTTMEPEKTLEPKSHQYKQDLIKRIQEQYSQDDSAIIKEEDIGIFNGTNFYMWKNQVVNDRGEKEDKYYIHTNPNKYENYEKLERSDADHDMIIVNKKEGTILCSISVINHEVVSSYLDDYTDSKKTGKIYRNDKKFKGIVTDEYSIEEAYEGAVDLYNSKVNPYDEIDIEQEENEIMY